MNIVRSKAVLVLWIICVIYVLCLSRFRICSLLPCVHLNGKGWPLGSCLRYLLCHFPMWYPGTGVVLDCIDSWSVLSFLLFTGCLLHLIKCFDAICSSQKCDLSKLLFFLFLVCRSQKPTIKATVTPWLNIFLQDLKFVQYPFLHFWNIRLARDIV